MRKPTKREIRHYTKLLQKASGLNDKQLKRQESERFVFQLLLRVFPYSVTFSDMVTCLKKSVSRKTIWNVLRTFQDEGIVDRATEQIIQDKKTQYKYTLYRLNLEKYSSRTFQKSAKSYFMQGLEQYPSFLYSMALGLRIRKLTKDNEKDGEEFGRKYIKAFNEDKGVQADIARMYRTEGALVKMKNTLEGRA